MSNAVATRECFAPTVFDPKGFQNPSGLSSGPVTPGQTFSNLCNAYGKAIHTAYGRTGSLLRGQTIREGKTPAQCG